MNKQYIIIAFLFSIICLILIGSCFTYYPKEKFDIVKWNENIEERYKMSKDLIRSKALIGKTKDEVIELLGDDFYERERDNIGYYLGFVPGIIVIDPDVLVIYFENEVVIKVEQIKT